MLNGWIQEAQEHWMAAAAFLTNAWASIVVKAATVAICGAIISGVTVGTTMLVRLDTQVGALETRIDERFTELSAKLAAQEAAGKERRDRLISTRDKQMEAMDKRVEELRSRVRALEAKK